MTDAHAFLIIWFGSLAVCCLGAALYELANRHVGRLRLRLEARLRSLTVPR